MDSLKNKTVEEDPFFLKILEHVLAEKGFDGTHYKINYIKRRVAVRMRASGTRDYLEYYQALKKNRDEVSLLFDRFTIHVTDFFRDAEVYNSMKLKVLPEIFRQPGSSLKIWCAGCSTGQEPYSIAITLRENSPKYAEKNIKIIATDIDDASIRFAERGTYPIASLKKLSSQQMSKWFLNSPVL